MEVAEGLEVSRHKHVVLPLAQDRLPQRSVVPTRPLLVQGPPHNSVFPEPRDARQKGGGEGAGRRFFIPWVLSEAGEGAREHKLPP
eukprot:767302-Hanusia_phi.AAC.1